MYFTKRSSLACNKTMASGLIYAIVFKINLIAMLAAKRFTNTPQLDIEKEL